MPKNAPERSATVIANLEALISALDSRAPQLERIGEQAIADDATALKVQALAQLASLRTSGD